MSHSYMACSFPFYPSNTLLMAGGKAAILDRVVQAKYEDDRATKWKKPGFLIIEKLPINHCQPRLISKSKKYFYNSYIEEIIKCHASCTVLQWALVNAKCFHD